MSYFLEQGVYFLSNPAFETTFGLGLQASSLKDRESVQAMRTVAASLDFYSERTEYSFIYNSTLGFALAATTTRMPAGESRRTPYIHMIFSGRHPHDAPGDYGFQAVYETGERDVSGVVGRAEVEAMPPWTLQGLSREQLAWLIYKLWRLLASHSSDDWPLLLSPDSLPHEEEPPLRLAQLMCALADLIPPFFRRALSGTTAAPAVGRADAFPIHLSASPEAYRLDDLPALRMEDSEDYFKSFCLKMAQAYQEAPEIFWPIMDRVDRGGLARLRQPTAERQMLAACCAMMEWEPPWCLEGEALSALEKRVQSMLPNQQEDHAFWEEQSQLLISSTPPDDLPELLEWFMQEQKPLEDQQKFLLQNYAHSPERFLRQSSCLKDGSPALVASLWECPFAEKIVDGWEPEGMGDPDVFYPYFAEQLRFWGDMPLSAVGADNALYYFSDQLNRGPDATLEELVPLLQGSLALLNSDSIENRLLRTLQKEPRLPELRLLQNIQESLLQCVSINQQLATLWRQERPADADAFKQWEESGRLLKITDRSFISEEYVRTQISALETVQAADNFTERFLPCLSALQVKELSRQVDFLAERAETQEEQEWLEKTKQRIIHSQDGYENLSLQKKPERTGLEDRLRRSNLSSLLRMAKEVPDIRADSSELAALWREQIQLHWDALGEDESLNLTPEDINFLELATRILEKTDKELAKGLCYRFLCECYPSLGSLCSIKTHYMGPMGENIQRYAQQKAMQCTIAELCEYERATPVYQVQAPPEAWANLSGRDRAEICVQVHQDVAARRTYTALWILEDPFCSLLHRLCDSTCQHTSFGSEETDVLLDCLAELTAMLPKQGETMKKLLWTWRQAPTGPSRKLRRDLLRRMEQVQPRPDYLQVKCALKIWKAVFRDSRQRLVWGETWKQQQKRWGGPPPSTKGTYQRTPVNDEPLETENTLLSGLDGLLARGDALIEGLFYWVGLVFRSPILLARLLLHKLMR